MIYNSYGRGGYKGWGRSRGGQGTGGGSESYIINFAVNIDIYCSEKRFKYKIRHMHFRFDVSSYKGM